METKDKLIARAREAITKSWDLGEDEKSLWLRSLPDLDELQLKEVVEAFERQVKENKEFAAKIQNKTKQLLVRLTKDLEKVREC